MTFSRFERQADRFAPVALLIIGMLTGFVPIGVTAALLAAAAALVGASTEDAPRERHTADDKAAVRRLIAKGAPSR